MRPRADARLLVPLVMQRHMFCGRSVVLQCVSHGVAASASSHHSRRTSGSQKEGRACRRGEKRVGDRRGPPILSGSGSGTSACMLVDLDEAGLHSTHAIARAHCQALAVQGLTFRALLSRALEYARVLEYEALHARKASTGLVLRLVQHETGGRSGGEVGQRRGGTKDAPPRPSHESEGPRLHAMGCCGDGGGRKPSGGVTVVVVVVVVVLVVVVMVVVWLHSV